MTTVDHPDGPAPAKGEGRALTIAGFVFAAVGLLFVFACPVGAIVSGVAMAKGDRLGKWALITNVAVFFGVFLVVGLAFGLGSRR